MVVTVYPLGTTVYDPERCFNGYTLYCVSHSTEEESICLIDMNGNIIHQWNTTGGRAKLLTDGNLLILERGRRVGQRNKRQAGDGSRIGEALKEYSWDGQLVWEYESERLPGSAHHDFERLENGNTLILCYEDVPVEYREQITDPVRKGARRLRGDAVFEVTPAKEVVWEWHMYKHIDLNRHCVLCNPADWSHCNLVRVLPENKWYDGGDERFKPGNVILSPRNLGFIFIVDRDSREVVWEYEGNYRGGLAGQHESYLIEKGLPGAGNILIFDNGSPPMRSLAHHARSYVLEVDPVEKRVVWKYENGMRFCSPFQSNVERLPNGNTLICESEGSRLFEVTREGEIVWEYAIEAYRTFGRAHRYPYDYCSQLAALGQPAETHVVPPAHVRTHPRRAAPSPPFQIRSEEETNT